VSAPGLVYDARFSWEGEIVRVVVAGDVVALPDYGWSLGGFGRFISKDWLLVNANLPGPVKRRRILADCIVAALNRRAQDLPATNPSACLVCKGTGERRGHAIQLQLIGGAS